VLDCTHEAMHGMSCLGMYDSGGRPPTKGLRDCIVPTLGIGYGAIAVDTVYICT
jgi:hypothetical protein